MQYTRLDDSFQERKKLKVNAILSDVRAAKQRDSSIHVYAETNPNFKVWFWDVVLEEFGCDRGIRVDVLIVRKYLPAVLKSILELGWFSHSKGTSKTIGWLPTATSVNSPIEPLADDADLDEYDKVISYLLFTEAVAQQMKARYGFSYDQDASQAYCDSIHFLEYRAEELYSADGAMKLIHDLELTATEETKRLAGVRIDKFRTGPDHSGQLKAKAVSRRISLQYCIKRVDEFLEKAAAAGIRLPDLPHLLPYPGYDYNH